VTGLDTALGELRAAGWPAPQRAPPVQGQARPLGGSRRRAAPPPPMPPRRYLLVS